MNGVPVVLIDEVEGARVTDRVAGHEGSHGSTRCEVIRRQWHNVRVQRRYLHGLVFFGVTSAEGQGEVICEIVVERKEYAPGVVILHAPAFEYRRETQ